MTKLWLLLLLCCSFSFALAKELPVAIPINDTFTERNISLDITLFEDASAALTLENIRSPDIARRFIPSTHSNPSFGFTKSAYWSRFQLDSLSQPLYLTLAYAQTDLAELWCANPLGAIILKQRAGDHVLLAEWPTKYREPTFLIHPSAHTCWMRVQTTSSLQLPLTLSTQAAFVEMRVQDTAFQALYFGALLVMLVYNGLIAITTRSMAYTSYSFFLACYALFQCAFGGIGYQILWRDQVGLSDLLTPFFVACIGLFSTAFAVFFLDLKITAPSFLKLGWLVGGLFFINCIAAWTLPYAHAIRSVMLAVPIWAGFLLGSGIYLAWQGVRTAQIYLTAWLFFIVGTLIIVLSRIGWLPVNAFTANASQIGSAIEFVLLCIALSYRIKTLQKNLLDAQERITETLRIAGQTLENKVQERTAALEQANKEILNAYISADASRQQAEIMHQEAQAAHQKASNTLQELKTTQHQLVAAEKMAALGLLVSNVSHEINSPLGAIHSSNMTIADSMSATLENMPRLLDTISREYRTLFLQLVSHIQIGDAPITTREERTLTKQLTTFLENAGVDGAVRKARLLVKLRAQSYAAQYLPLLTSPDTDFILSVAAGVSDVLSGTSNIHSATDKVSRILASLKEISGGDRTLSLFENHVYQSMEKAIASLNSKLYEVDVVRIYQDMGPLRCDPDALYQAFIHLILNGLQAMNHRGVLMIGLRSADNHAEIRIADFGCGIAPEIKDRIFEPFFTTLASGEGSGMGLAIVKKIVEQHQGRIDVQSEVGVGTTITVILPYQI